MKILNKTQIIILIFISLLTIPAIGQELNDPEELELLDIETGVDFEAMFKATNTKEPVKIIYPGSISGHVLNKNNFPFKHCTVSVTPEIKTKTDPHGYYQLKEIPPGIYNLTVQIEKVIKRIKTPTLSSSSKKKKGKKNKKKKSKTKSSGLNIQPQYETVSVPLAKMEIKYIRIRSKKAVKLGKVNPDLKKDYRYSKTPSEKELQYYNDLQQKYLAQIKNNAFQYKQDLIIKGKYNNFFNQDTLYPLVKEAAWHSIIPGFGQFYNRRKIRGIIYLTSEIAALTGYLIFRTRGADYEDQYLETSDINDLIHNKTYKKAADNIRYSNTALYFVYSIPVIAMLDAIIDSWITQMYIQDRLKLSSIPLNKDAYTVSMSYSF